MLFDLVLDGTAANVRLDTVPDLGRVLRAVRPFAPGDTVLIEAPLVTIIHSADALAATASPPAALQAAILTTSQRILPFLGRHIVAADAISPFSFAHCIELYRLGTAAFQQRMALLYGGDLDEDAALGHFRSLARDLLLAERPPPEDLECTVSSLARVLAAFTLNGHEVDSQSTSLFLAGALAAHSCAPNLWFRTDPTSGHLTYRALRPISTDDVLAFSYLDEAQLRQPTLLRRRYLFATKRFHCACPRCVAEDTVRTLPCPACPTGLLYHAWQRPDSHAWQCRACSQSVAATASSAAAERAIVDAMPAALAKLLATDAASPESIDGETARLAATVGPAHWAVMALRFAAVGALFRYAVRQPARRLAIDATHTALRCALDFCKWAAANFGATPGFYTLAGLQTVRNAMQYVEGHLAGGGTPPEWLLRATTALARDVLPQLQLLFGPHDADVLAIQAYQLRHCGSCGHPGGSAPCATCHVVLPPRAPVPHEPLDS